MAATPAPPRSEKSESAAAKYHLYSTVFTAYLASMSFGSAVTYSSPALPDIRPKMNFTTEDSAWFGSLVKCGSIFGGLLGGQLVNIIGRRATLFASSPWFLTGWLCIIFGPSKVLLFVGRTLTGVGVGIVAPAVPVYISEISPAHERGFLNTGGNLVVIVGVLLTFVLGKWLHYELLAVALMAPTVLMTILLLWAKESPRWLLQKGRREAALDSIIFYHGLEGRKRLGAIEESLYETGDFSFRDLARPYIIRPFLCALLVMFVQQSSAVGVLVVFANDIFRDAKTPISPADCTIIVGAVMLIIVAAATVLTDRLGRKILILSSTLATALSLFLLGYSFYMKEHSAEAFGRYYSWLPIVAMGFFFVAFGIGLAALPWVLLGEILPLRVRGFASGFCTAFTFGYSFLLIKEFYHLQLLLTIAGTYWLFGALLLAGFALILAFLPETKGKTLEEIEHFFWKGH